MKSNTRAGMFAQGLPLIGMVDRELALDLDLFSRGGLEILRAIEQQDYNVLRARPVHLEIPQSCAPAPRPHAANSLRAERRCDARAVALLIPTIDASPTEYAREIARTQAKNFYYAFVALPKPKRNAICAVYAFMRHADDLSDDESRSREDAVPIWHLA